MSPTASVCQPGPPRPRPRLEVADILRAYAPAYLQSRPVTASQRKVIEDILACRTAALGGHLEVCDTCGHQQVSYNSCRNRHCPKCQSLAQAHWIEQRKERVLPVGHFHVVFTLPSELRPLALRNQALLYKLLFRTAAQTLLDLGRDPALLGAQLGLTAVLHTWSRDLSYHPHLHCIVTGGGLSLDGTRWVAKSGKYLFPVTVLATVFRGKFMQGLTQSYQQGQLRLPGPCAWLQQRPAFDVFKHQLYQTPWVVYAKRPFGGAEHVYSYLGRYTHRVGISNQRLLGLDSDGVHFHKKGSQTVTLPPLEFIRRFLLHVLPPGLVKIRHYGLLASSNVKTKLEVTRRLLTPPAPPAPCIEAPETAALQAQPEQPPSVSAASVREPTLCPACHTGRMVSYQLPRPSYPLRQLARFRYRPAAPSPAAGVNTC